MRAQPENLMDVWLSPQNDSPTNNTELAGIRKTVEFQPVSEAGAALSERIKPPERLPRVAHRWDVPPIDERTVDMRQVFDDVRSMIVTTPAGEQVLWGNRQATLILEEARALIHEEARALIIAKARGFSLEEARALIRDETRAKID